MKSIKFLYCFIISSFILSCSQSEPNDPNNEPSKDQLYKWKVLYYETGYKGEENNIIDKNTNPQFVKWEKENESHLKYTYEYDSDRDQIFKTRCWEMSETSDFSQIYSLASSFVGFSVNYFDKSDVWLGSWLYKVEASNSDYNVLFNYSPQNQSSPNNKNTWTITVVNTYMLFKNDKITIPQEALNWISENKKFLSYEYVYQENVYPDLLEGYRYEWTFEIDDLNYKYINDFILPKLNLSIKGDTNKSKSSFIFSVSARKTNSDILLSFNKN